MYPHMPMSLTDNSIQGKIEALGGKMENRVEKDTMALVSDKGRNNSCPRLSRTVSVL